MEEKTPVRYFHISLEDLNSRQLAVYLLWARNNDQIRSDDTLVLSSLREVYPRNPVLAKLLQRLSERVTSEKFQRCILVVNNIFPTEIRVPDNIDIVQIEHFAADLRYRRMAGVPFNQQWNPNAKKALFLTGKVGKPNRAILLYKFIQAGLIARLEYSFLPYQSANMDINVSEEFSRLFDEDYDTFAKRYARTPDDILHPLTVSDKHVSTGYSVPVSLYQDTVLSVIPESEIGKSPRIWLTEKTWRTIANRHPFIIVGQTGTLSHLKSLGFRTFENYLLHKKYDRVRDLDGLLNQTVENTEYFLNNYHNHVDEINEDIEHNLNTLDKLIQENIDVHEMFQDDRFYFNFFDSIDIDNQLKEEDP